MSGRGWSLGGGVLAPLFCAGEGLCCCTVGTYWNSVTGSVFEMGVSGWDAGGGCLLISAGISNRSLGISGSLFGGEGALLFFRVLVRLPGAAFDGYR